MNYVLVTFGLVVGNFMYQAFAGHDWESATERSFFQAVAVLLCWALT
jgi:hypothetical protein